MKLMRISILISAVFPALSSGNDELALAPSTEQAPIEESIIENTPSDSVESTVQEAAIQEATAQESIIPEVADSIVTVDSAAVTDSAVAAVDSAASEEEYLDFSGAFFPTIRGTFVNSPYGIRKNRLHRGVDLHLTIGDSVVAAYPGKVVVSKYNRRGYGNYVMIEHANGTKTLYAHLQKRLVNVGDKVEGGQLIGRGGNTGRSSGPHLHFEIRYGEVNIDPATVFDFEKGELLPNTDKYALAPAIDSHNVIQAELSKHRYHRVRPGDTLGKIARMYGTTIEKLCKLNKITRTTILQIGQSLQCS